MIREFIVDLFKPVSIPLFFMFLMLIINSYVGFLLGQNHELLKRRNNK